MSEVPLYLLQCGGEGVPFERIWEKRLGPVGAIFSSLREFALRLYNGSNSVRPERDHTRSHVHLTQCIH